MKRRRLRGLRFSVLGGLAVATAACHHVIIDGGLEPTETRYDEEWNLAFAAAIYPAQVDANDRCGGHFSRVETRQSFLNFIVAAWTVGWISPMQARFDCGTPAGGNADAEAPAGKDRTEGRVEVAWKEANRAR